MGQISAVRFWVTSALAVAALAVVLSAPRGRGKGWLAGFIGLSLATSIGFFLPARSGALRDLLRAESYMGFLALLSVAGWVLLLVYAARQSALPPASVGDTGRPALAAAGGPPGSGPEPDLFLHVSVTRLVLLSIASCGLYEVYWIYKNWWYLKRREGLPIRPFWRAAFAYFFTHGLLRRIHEDREARAVLEPGFSPSALATGFVVFAVAANVLSRAASGPAVALALIMPSYLFLVPVQRYVNAVCDRRSPGSAYHPWSAGHIACLLVGLAAWAAVIGSGG